MHSAALANAAWSIFVAPLFAYSKTAFAAAEPPLDTDIDVHEGIVSRAHRHAGHGDTFKKFTGYHLIPDVAVDAEPVRQAARDATAATHQRRAGTKSQE